MLSSWSNRYARLVTRLPVKDAASGFTCISTEALARIRLSVLGPSRYAFTIALKYALWKHGALIR